MDTLPRGSPYPQDIRRIFDAINDGPLLARLNHYRWTGRKGYTPAAMWRAVLLKHLLRLRYTRDLIAQLRASRHLRRLCGFRDAVPSESTFSRFYARLADHQDLVDQALTTVSAAIGDALAQLKEEGRLPADAPNPGQAVAMDSTDIPAFANPRRSIPSDADAVWGHRTPKSNQDAKGSLFYGYKLHATCDAYYGTPLSWCVLPANANDAPQLPPLMDQLAANFPRQPARFLMADRGYDGMPNYRYLDERRINAVIQLKDTDKSGLYDVSGRPSCIGGRPMRYVRTDRGKGHLFRCNPDDGDGCPLKDSAPWLGARCASQHHETWGGDLLRRVGRLPRASRRWARLYNLRASVERMFGSLKRSRLLAQHSCYGLRRVRLHVALSLLTYAGSMLARLLAGDVAHIRDMSVNWTPPAPDYAVAA